MADNGNTQRPTCRRHSNGRRFSASQERFLHNILEQASSLFPTLRLNTLGKLSYLELEHMANQLAHFLVSNGIRTGMRVGIWSPRCSERYISILGDLKSGATYVPIDPATPTYHVRDILNDTDVSLLLTNNLMTTNSSLQTKFVSWDELHHVVTEFPKHRVATPGLTGASLCYIIYTSGSTGKPKGVKISHKNIVHYIHVMQKAHRVYSHDRIYQGCTIASLTFPSRKYGWHFQTVQL